MDTCPLQYLLSLPPGMARVFAALEGKHPPSWFAGSDPLGRKLGSGGGTAHLLAEAWRATRSAATFEQWLLASPKLMIHGGGQSRRLPAYGPAGKILMPLPVFRWARGQRLDQSLLDVQLPDYERVLRHAGRTFAAMVCSGDVLLRFAAELPPFPQVDVLGLGMWVTPEKAREFGVFFSPRRQPNELAFFLQKPEAARIREWAADHIYLVDTGMWLLSARAVRVLMEKCGWNPHAGQFESGVAEGYELYGQFGPALGTHPTAPDPDVSPLTCAVVPLPQAEFYHFGTTRQMIESISALQNRELDETKLGTVGARRHPDQFVQSALFHLPLRREENRSLWVENSHIPSTWALACEHVLTGVPANTWNLRLERGVCLDFVPVHQAEFCLRPYGFDDRFQGAIEAPATRWFGRPVREWFESRGLSPESAGMAPSSDIQTAPLFPVLPEAELDPRLIEWMFSSTPVHDPALATRWIALPRLSAQEIGAQANLTRLYAQRRSLRRESLEPLMRNACWSVFYRLDLSHTADDFAATSGALPPAPQPGDSDPLNLVHDDMFRAAVLRRRGEPDWERHEAKAFDRLRGLIVQEIQLAAVRPECTVQEDQIVWGRSPVRLDLAGGWTDTPPYCLEQGGRVLNLAVDLNGQPPIQVFAKLCPRPELVVRSIDLGVEQRLRTYAEVDTFAEPGSEFALAKAGFALAGFLPRFHSEGGFRSLEEQLQAFGGGIELSLLAAVPKGSGLGTSSILAATLLATLGDLCGLSWDRVALFKRTLAMEQMLTTGGGWQDQAGAIFGGVKLIETEPGLDQTPNVRWLPSRLFGPEYANRTVLLYYTGITRLAKNILQEIVRGIFLNAPTHLSILEQLAANAARCFNALQRIDDAGLLQAVNRSWQLNQALDAGTNPPPIQALIDRLQPWLAACKLLGAGGGGFLLMFARDEDAAARIREELTSRPPNGRARFVNMTLSEGGLKLTRS
jgi:galactokinase/mevalonate kinase-like predicted kinase